MFFRKPSTQRHHVCLKGAGAARLNPSARSPQQGDSENSGQRGDDSELRDVCNMGHGHAAIAGKRVPNAGQTIDPPSRRRISRSAGEVAAQTVKMSVCMFGRN
jgi:hypothetical protein